MGNHIYFVSENENGEDGIYKCNGNVGGVILVKSFNNYDLQYDNHLPMFFASSTNIFFEKVNNTSSGYEIWKSDGTEAGTIFLFAFEYPYYLQSSMTHSNLLYFTRRNTTDETYDLYRSDGTVAGTYPLLTNQGGINNLSIFNSSMYFTAFNSQINYYKTDGTVVGTLIVKPDFPNGEGGSYTSNNSTYSSKYIQLPDNSYVSKLIQFDGKQGGQIYTHNFTQLFNYIYGFHAGNGLLYFKGDQKTGPVESFAGLYAIKDCSLNFDALGTISNSNIREDLGKFSSIQKLNSATNNQYFAKNSIELKPGFKAEAGSLFKAQVGGCLHDPAN
jgi:hypothetical protein